MTMIQPLEKLEKEVSDLPKEQLEAFRAWFEKFDASAWDRQFEEDVAKGRLDEIARKAISDFKKANYKKL